MRDLLGEDLMNVIKGIVEDILKNFDMDRKYEINYEKYLSMKKLVGKAYLDAELDAMVEALKKMRGRVIYTGKSGYAFVPDTKEDTKKGKYVRVEDVDKIFKKEDE